MALTSRLGIVADCFPDPDGEPDLDRMSSANEELIELIRNSRRFPTEGNVRLIDIGYGRAFPNSEVVYLDSAQFLLDELDRPNKVCADATQIPFPDNSFDIAYAGHIISEGVLKDHWHSKDESYRIAREGHRVLKRGGLFVFTYCMGNDAQTLTNLSEIGYKELEHLQRIKWFKGIPTDTYAAKK